jgi:polysaccharide pyruvyl transferase WcaK-like protein
MVGFGLDLALSHDRSTEKYMKTISIFDTSVSSDNLGDEIIMEAVSDVLSGVAPNAYAFKVPTHENIGRVSHALIAKSDLCVVGGTNLLQSNMFARNALWKLKMADALKLRRVLLLGVGWRGYMGPPSRASKALLSRILHPALNHSLRDAYSCSLLRDVLPNVSNTSCVTMWGLTSGHCETIPSMRSPSAVTTLTYYNADPHADRQMLRTVVASYGRVYFWPQQAQDREYFASLNVMGIIPIGPSLRAYDALLESEDVDFVGTRLHGGVRALQYKHRAVIVPIDNRAAEIARDTGLPTVRRGDPGALEAWIDGGGKTVISLPWQAIQDWKDQIRRCV